MRTMRGSLSGKAGNDPEKGCLNDALDCCPPIYDGMPDENNRRNRIPTFGSSTSSL
jgi:hypothetical protein